MTSVMTSLATSLRSSLQPQAGGANGSVTLFRMCLFLQCWHRLYITMRDLAGGRSEAFGPRMARCQISACHHVRRQLPDGLRKRVTHKILHSLLQKGVGYADLSSCLNRDHCKTASPLASSHQPMDHVFNGVLTQDRPPISERPLPFIEQR